MRRSVGDGRCDAILYSLRWGLFRGLRYIYTVTRGSIRVPLKYMWPSGPCGGWTGYSMEEFDKQLVARTKLWEVSLESLPQVEYMYVE